VSDSEPGTDGVLTTGVPAVDRALGGGVSPGSLVAVVARPAVESEPLLYAPASEHPTRYLTALRPRAAIETAPRTHGADVGGDVEVEAVDGDALDAPEAHLGGLEPASLLVVDPVTEAEQGEREAYRAFLDAVDRACRMIESVALLHFVETRPATLRRDLALAPADVVFDIEVLRRPRRSPPHGHEGLRAGAPRAPVSAVVPRRRGRGAPVDWDWERYRPAFPSGDPLGGR